MNEEMNTDKLIEKPVEEMNIQEQDGPYVRHVSGPFYEARNAEGDYFFGPEHHAKDFVVGEYNKTPRELT